tara:strand:- start:558 stop:683 length:126 start_codon:yes stop_codon:yes gene_type:complete
MKDEIEWKFIVIDPAFKNDAIFHHYIQKGYLRKNPDRTVEI